MSEHLAGVTCPDCAQVITLPVDIQTHHDAMGKPYESIEPDMRGWDAHARWHRETPLVFNILSREASDGVIGTWT